MSRSKKVNVQELASSYSRVSKEWQATGSLLKENKEYLIRCMKEQKIKIISLASGDVFELVASEKLVCHKADTGKKRSRERVTASPGNRERVTKS